ncbi:hypothetical protein KUTeg_001180 [Tegillarca granosa]|uniref:Protein MIS12 homolog n=1 Tax=Tegillarca granosa TaxID=220873 RepID=A0ABQ9FVP1_TEGGR|nr:hypothetical protein KUTeg_001180 [Tegillarca granosa]
MPLSRFKQIIDVCLNAFVSQHSTTHDCFMSVSPSKTTVSVSSQPRLVCLSLTGNTGSNSKGDNSKPVKRKGGKSDYLCQRTMKIIAFSDDKYLLGDKTQRYAIGYHDYIPYLKYNRLFHYLIRMASVSEADSTMKSDFSDLQGNHGNNDNNDGGEEDVTSSLQEYETQHFGFTPKSFLNGIYNAIVEYLREGLDVMEQYIHQEFSNVMTENQIKEATSKLLPHLVKKLDRVFDFLEKYLLENVFHIPDNVILPEDEVQLTTSYTKTDEEAINEENSKLKDQILALKYANFKIQQELYQIEHVQTKLDNVLAQFQQLQDISEKAGVSDTKAMML